MKCLKIIKTKEIVDDSDNDLDSDLDCAIIERNLSVLLVLDQSYILKQDTFKVVARKIALNIG